MTRVDSSFCARIGRGPALRPAAAALFMACALALLPACWAPPFDAAISVSKLFEGKLEKVASIGPVDYSGDGFETCYFVPALESSPKDGFLVCMKGDRNLIARYVGLSSGSYFLGPEYWGGQNHWGNLNAVLGMTVDNCGYSLSTSVRKAIHIFGTGMVGNGTDTAAVRGIGCNTSYAFDTYQDAPTTGFSLDMIPIGGSTQGFYTGVAGIYRNLLMASSSGAPYKLAVSGMHGQMDNVSYASALPTIGNNVFTYDVPELLEGAFFLEYGDMVIWDLVIGTVKGSGEVVGLRWDAAYRNLAPERISFASQVTDALNDGKLLARGEISTECFDLNGNLLFSIPTGSIRFIFEHFFDSTWYCYFTRTTFVRDGYDDSSGKLYIDIFRCPTDSLAGLAP
jgi:hypothetical protein